MSPAWAAMPSPPAEPVIGINTPLLEQTSPFSLSPRDLRPSDDGADVQSFTDSLSDDAPLLRTASTSGRYPNILPSVVAQRHRQRVPSHLEISILSGPDISMWDRLRGSARRKWDRGYAMFGPLEWLGHFIPAVSWLRKYSWADNLLADVVAGLTVGVMTVPEALSYARIAGLPSEYGLYGAFMPVLAYAVFGSSRQMAVGPVVITSLLLMNGVSALVPAADVNQDPSHPVDPLAQAAYNTAAIQISLLVGLMYAAVGLLRLGFLTNFLSRSVISGFTTGAALVIGASQLKLLVGFHIPRYELIFDTLAYLARHVRETQPQELLMGLTWLTALLAIKAVGRRHKRWSWLLPLGPLIVSALSIATSFFSVVQVRVVGHIPQGLPPLTLGKWALPRDDLPQMMTSALTITLVGLMESIAVAKALADTHRYQISANQELLGLGIANLVGAAWCCYPVGGSFSRSAVNNDTGARSALAGVCTAGLVGAALLYCTPLFEHMPLNALGAIVIASVYGLVQYEECLFLWKIAKLDWLVWVTSLLGTVFLGISTGLSIAIGMALLFVIYESAYPHTALLGKLPHTYVYRNVKQYPEAEQLEGIMLVRLDAALYFANVQYIRERLQHYQALWQEAAVGRGSKWPLRYVIMDLSPVPHIDASAVRMLQELLREFQGASLQLVISNPSNRVFGMMECSGLLEQVGPEFVFVQTHDAVEYCQAILCGRATRISEEGRYYVAPPGHSRVPPPSPLMSEPLSFSIAVPIGEPARGPSTSICDSLTQSQRVNGGIRPPD